MANKSEGVDMFNIESEWYGDHIGKELSQTYQMQEEWKKVLFRVGVLDGVEREKIFQLTGRDVTQLPVKAENIPDRLHDNYRGHMTINPNERAVTLLFPTRDNEIELQWQKNNKTEFSVEGVYRSFFNDFFSELLIVGQEQYGTDGEPGHEDIFPYITAYVDDNSCQRLFDFARTEERLQYEDALRKNGSQISRVGLHVDMWDDLRVHYLLSVENPVRVQYPRMDLVLPRGQSLAEPVARQILENHKITSNMPEDLPASYAYTVNRIVHGTVTM